MAFNGLRSLLDPSIALPMAGAMMSGPTTAQGIGNAFILAGQGMGTRRDEQKRLLEMNKTFQYLQQTNPELAQMVQAGMPVAEAWKMIAEDRKLKAQTPSTDDIKEYEYAKRSGMFEGSFTDWQTKGVRDQDASFGREQNLRKEYTATPEYKRFDDVRASYERVRASASRQSGAGDLGLIFGFMKMLDPGSVVREGEFANAQNAGGVTESVRNLYNRVISGERLSNQQRQEFVNTAQDLYDAEAKRVSSLNERYGQIAGQYEIDPKRVTVQPPQYEPLQMGQSRDLGNGVTIQRID